MKELSLEKADYGSSVIAGSPDGKWIAAVYEKRIALVSVADGREMASLTAEKLGVSQVAFSADSQFLAIGAADDKQVLVSLWDVSTAKKLHEWGWELGKDRTPNVEALAFSPDGSEARCCRP